MSRAEKFIEDYTRNCYNYNSYAQDPIPWLTPDDARKAVEIAREEMMAKACEYLDLHCNEVKTEDNGIAGWIDNEFITNFRKAMEEQ